MPIAANPDGVLDIENATLRSREIATLSNFVAGNDEIRSSGAPVVEVYGDPANVGGFLPTLELVSNTESVAGTSFTRFTSNAGVFSLQSGTGGDADSKGDIAFSSVGGDTEHMRIQGSTSRVGIGTTSSDGPLHIFKSAPNNGDTGPGIILARYDNTYGGCIWSESNNNIDGLYFNAFLNTAASTAYGATPKMVINSNGNVGIGTNNPSAKLHIYTGATENAVAAKYESTGGGYGSIEFRGSRGPGTNGSQIGRIQSYWQNNARGAINFTDGGDIALLPTRNVGIGVNSPLSRLHVNGTNGAMSTGYRRFFSWNENLTYNYVGWGNGISIYAQSSILTSSHFVSHSGTLSASDRRIKTEIQDVDDIECLEVLRHLQPKKYKYKDAVERGEEPVWGFIAQEVRETLPYATELRRDALPDIYEIANVSSSNIITFTHFNTSNLDANTSTIEVITIDEDREKVKISEIIDDHTIRVEEDLSKWTGSIDETGNVITEITTTTLTPEEYDALEDKSGYVANITGYQNVNVVVSVEEYNALEDATGYEEIIENYTKTETIYPGTQLFVYGQEVDDFVFLKKEAIFTVATAALQEIDRQLQAEKARNDALEARIAALESA